MKLAIAYASFAAIAITVNLLVQALVTALDPTPYRFWSALAAGTAAGLVVKYLLDKQYIFRADHLTRPVELGHSFLRYAASGLLTTAIFWGMQLAFHHGLPGVAGAKYLGGALGLTLGYLWKYRLDRRFAFARP